MTISSKVFFKFNGEIRTSNDMSIHGYLTSNAKDA